MLRVGHGSTPLRSTTGKLTSSELIIESGLRRDIVYGDHRDLVDGFQAQAKARPTLPEAMQKLAEVRDQMATTKEALTAERARTKALLRAVTELFLELEQTREQLAGTHQVIRLPAPRR